MALKTVLIPVSASTWATVERLTGVASRTISRPVTAEEIAATLLEMGLRAMAEGLHATCDPQRMEVARALMGIEQPKPQAATPSLEPAANAPSS